MPDGPIPSPIDPDAATPLGPTVASDRLVGVLGDWSSGGHGNLSRRLAQAFRHSIIGGALPAGTRLPAERRLAALLSVSRSTVTSALDELRSEGLLSSRQGRGTQVAGPPQPGVTGDRVSAHFVSRPEGIDLAAVVPTDGSHLPALAIRTEDLFSGAQLQPEGLPVLRDALARRFDVHHVPTRPGEVQVTHGAHHAIGLTLASLVAPGRAVAMEDPTYPGMLDLVDHHRCRAVAIPGDRGGPDPEALARTLRREQPALVYLQTGVHNPTGRTMGPARRRALAAVLDEYGEAVVVEDDPLADLVFAGRPRPSVSELCRLAPVVSVESTSKVAWATLRIGWLRATGVVGEQIRRVRVATDLGASVPSQLLTLQLLPHLAEMAETRRRTIDQGIDRAMARIADQIDGWEVERPEGSSALWPRLPMADAAPFVALARRFGVHVTPGAAHLVEPGPDPHIRICVDRPTSHVDEGIDRLAAAWRDATARAARNPA